MSVHAEAAPPEAGETISWRQRALGAGIMAVSLVAGAIGVEQSFEAPHSVDTTLVVGAVLGLLIGKEVLKN